MKAVHFFSGKRHFYVSMFFSKNISQNSKNLPDNNGINKEGPRMRPWVI